MKPLSRRELECLHWASLGKTSWEIGAILGITERTINFHIQNACRKLQVRGRQAAITAAHHAGLLHRAVFSASLPANPETAVRTHVQSHLRAP
ncbi:MAG TPA: helix-turn-helix transcriptional regulator [Pusillimonas sp.]|uniref:helix-turn-helix domain-containing protein n=1 Tax=Pusillimonas sp. TaxID=3040095 RepID=UPI002C1D6B99|nr:helix-turn-helix transcriptional regulator [Pusillimonas sp.]HUH89003.1 helix-turn-helix transcriptional regulator [Pusillimonas sp.]